MSPARARSGGRPSLGSVPVPGGRANLSIAILAGGTLSLSFTVQLWAISQLGPGSIGDAYFGVAGVPALLLTLVADSLSLVLVPTLAQLPTEEQAEEVGNYLWLVGLFLGGLALLLWALAPLWIRWVFPGFDQDGAAAAILLARIELPALLLYGVAEVLRALRHARGAFVRSAASLFSATAVSLLFVITQAPRLGVAAFGWAFVIRAVVDVILLGTGLVAPAMLVPRRSEGFRGVLQRTLPLALVTGYFRLDGIVDRSLASLAPAGNLSLLVFGQQVLTASGQIMNRSLVTPIVPTLASHSAREEMGAFALLYRRRRRVVVVAAVILLGLLVYPGRQALSLLSLVGTVSAGDTQVLWGLMVALGGVVLGDASGNLAANAYYARGDTVTPSRVSALIFTAGLGLKVGAFFAMGVVGLALATSAYYVARSGWLNLGVLRTRGP